MSLMCDSYLPLPVFCLLLLSQTDSRGSNGPPPFHPNPTPTLCSMRTAPPATLRRTGSTSPSSHGPQRPACARLSRRESGCGWGRLWCHSSACPPAASQKTTFLPTSSPYPTLLSRPQPMAVSQLKQTHIVSVWLRSSLPPSPTTPAGSRFGIFSLSLSLAGDDCITPYSLQLHSWPQQNQNGDDSLL